MRPHPKPRFPYRVSLVKELQRLGAHRAKPDRAIPARTDTNVLIATWNLTNFGAQKRRTVHLQLMADILKPFDVVAVQEIGENITHLVKLAALLGPSWKTIYTDPAGNRERAAYFYNAERVVPTGLAAELAMRGYENAAITIENVTVAGGFTGFNRNPFIVGFRSGRFEFFLINVHLYWSNSGLRQLETKALARWAKSRVNKAFPPNHDLILIGDFNMPRVRPGDSFYELVTEYGLTLPKHTTDLVGTNLAGDADYDEVAFFPSRTDEDFTRRMGVFDFDNAVFPDLYQSNEKGFFQYVRYYLADHRPLWVEFKR